MPTLNPRIHVTLPPDVAGVVNAIAKKQNSSQSEVIRQLTEFSLELMEDKYFSELADKRAESGGKTISEKEFWKNVL